MPVVAAAGIAAVGGMAAGALSSKGAGDAAKTQASAIDAASRTSIEQANKARLEILDRIEPALIDYNRSIVKNQNEIKQGSADIMQILSQSTANASELLSSAGVNASKAIMGSRAYTSGTSRQDFEQSFARMDSAGPSPAPSLAPSPAPSPAPPSVPAPRTAIGAGLGAILDATKAAAPGAIEAAARGEVITPAGQLTADQRRQKAQAEARLAGLGAPETTPGVFDPEGFTPGAISNWRTNRDEIAAAHAEIAGIEKTAAATTVPEVAALDRPMGAEYLPSVQTGAYGEGPGYFTAVEALERGKEEGLGALASGAGLARGDIRTGLAAGREAFQPYETAGRAAIDEEAALSGALGPEAQQRAIDAYMESPGQKYLRERQEQALLRSSAAVGGLGGGNIRTALQEQAMGIASTQQQQHLENLRSLAGRGQQVAGQVAGLETGAASQLSQLANALGVNSAQLVTMNQQQLAALAERTGINLANIQQTIGAAQAGLQERVGGQLAQTSAGMTDALTGLGERAATTGLTVERGVGTTLANLATQQGTQLAGLEAGKGAALAAGQYASGQAVSQGLQGVANLGAYAAANWPQQQPQPVVPPPPPQPVSPQSTTYYM